MPSPAEKLAAKKQRERPPRNHVKVTRAAPVTCHLRAMRQQLNLSIADVADEVGMSVAGLHAIELGGNVKMATAFRLAGFFGLTIDEAWSKS